VSEKYLVRFEDKSILHKKFTNLKDAKDWASDYVHKFPRPTKVTILQEVCVIQTQYNVIETEIA
jgi:hypothetical protein